MKKAAKKKATKKKAMSWEEWRALPLSSQLAIAKDWVAKKVDKTLYFNVPELMELLRYGDGNIFVTTHKAADLTELPISLNVAIAKLSERDLVELYEEEVLDF